MKKEISQKKFQTNKFFQKKLCNKNFLGNKSAKIIYTKKIHEIFFVGNKFFGKNLFHKYS